MECEDIHRLLDAYLHRELDRDDQLEAERHLILCPSCASLLQEHQEFRAVFRNTASGRKAPPQLKARILAAARREEAKQRFAFLRESWVYAAAMILLGLFLALNIVFPDRQKEFSRQAVTLHSDWLSSNQLVEVASSKAEAVRLWLTSKLNFAPPVVDSPGSGYSLLGGRVTMIRNRPVAALVYQHDNGVVTLFCWPPEKEQLVERDDLIKGYHVCTWSNAQCNYILVSKLSDRDMNELLESLRIHVRSGTYF
jgi:anti-sigma factor RsiW